MFLICEEILISMIFVTLMQKWHPQEQISHTLANFTLLTLCSCVKLHVVFGMCMGVCIGLIQNCVQVVE